MNETLSALEAPFRAALASGSFGMALLLIFAAGLATSLTPCVYPMIVITVSVFGAQETKSRFEAAKLSTAFVLGIALLFTPMGIVAAVTGDVFGGQLANPIVLWSLAALFVAMAASMFGAFEMDLPPAIRNRLAQAGGVGIKGALVLGMVSALIAAPCVGPVVGFLLTWVGTSQNVVFGAASLFVYSIGLGMLFWLVGTFSMSLPKSGQWLENIKSVFGVVMVAVALYFVRDLIPGLAELGQRTGSFLGGALALLALGLAVGAVHLSFHGASVVTRLRKSAGIAAAVAGLYGLVAYADALPDGAKIEWLDDYHSARTLASSSGRPLLVDFGASWCGACEELDRHTFSDPRVVREGLRFVPVRVDLSPGKDSPEKRAVLAAYNQRGLPLVVLHDHEGKEVARITNFVKAESMLKIMREVR